MAVVNGIEKNDKVKVSDAVFIAAVAVILFAFFAPWYMGCSGHDIASAGNHEFFLVPVLPLAAAIALFFGLRVLSLVLSVLGSLSLISVFFRFFPEGVAGIQWGFWLTVGAYAVTLSSSAIGVAHRPKRRRRG